MKQPVLMSSLAAICLIVLGCGGPSEEEQAQMRDDQVKAEMIERGHRMPLPFPMVEGSLIRGAGAKARLSQVTEAVMITCASRTRDELAEDLGLDSTATDEEIGREFSANQLSGNGAGGLIEQTCIDSIGELLKEDPWGE